MGFNGMQERMSADIKTKQIKKRRSTNIFKVALFMVRRGKSSRKASVHADEVTKSLWRKLFGSATTLRLENNINEAHTATKSVAIVPEDDQKKLPPQTETFANAKPAFLNLNVDVKMDEKATVLQSDNPQSSPSCASSSSGCEESRYASAVNLRELDVCDEEINGNADDDEEEECQFDDSAGDSMIDIKAEMFIAQFYEQMRLQNT